MIKEHHDGQPVSDQKNMDVQTPEMKCASQPHVHKII